MPSPDEVVGEIFAMDTRETVKYTVANIAVIAVMAGARPEHFPVILAIASTRQTALMPSTTAFGAMLMVNGPIRNEIGMNCGIGAFSAVNQANSVIGRAWLLMSHMLGLQPAQEDSVELPGQQSHLQQHVLRRE